MSEEKREEATPRSVLRARARGRVWQSRDLTLAAALGSAGLALHLGREALVSALRMVTLAPLVALERGESVAEVTLHVANEGALLAGPLLGALVVSTAIVSAVQVGPLFAPRAIEADPARLDPMARLGELFGPRAAATATMTVARLALVGSAVIWTLDDALPGIATLSRQTPDATLEACLTTLVALLLRSAAAMAALGVIDAVLERTLHQRSLRMSRREVERERREVDGDESVARERERVRSEIRDQDLEISFASARIVLWDELVAVALSYDAEDLEAVPRVVASGRGLVRDRLLALAEASTVALRQDDALAPVLALVPYGHAIPEASYEAVARALHDVEGARS